MDEFLKALRPVKRRIRLGRFASGAAAGFAFGAAAALVLLTVTVFVPLEGRLFPAGILAAGCTLLFAAGNALRPVKDAEAARAADSCGLQERAVTALELAGAPETELLEIQRKDACEHLRGLDPRQIRFRLPRRLLIAGTAALALCVLPALIHAPGDRLAESRREFRDKVAEMEKQVEEAAEAEEKSGLSEKEKAELRRLAEDLKRDLSESRDAVDAMVALDKAEKRMEEMRPYISADTAQALQALADALRGAGMDGAAQAVESGDAAGLSAEAEKLDASALRDAAEALSGEAREMAEQLAQAAEQGQMSAADAQSLMNGAAAQQAQSGQPGQSGQSAQSGQQSPMQQAISGMKAAMNGQGSSPGASFSGQGNQQGQQPGGGAGTGTTNEEQKGGGQPGEKKGTKGDRPPEYKEAEYESIYDPEKAEAATRDVTTEQNSGNKDSVQIEAGPGKGTLDGNVPYRQVIGDYAREEAAAADSAALTAEQKQWVDEYFRRLTEE